MKPNLLGAAIFAAWMRCISSSEVQTTHRALFLECPSETQVKNLWAPRFCKHIDADIICTTGFGPKIHYGGMILGDVIDEELNVEFKGEFTMESGICKHIEENGGETGRNKENDEQRKLDINYGVGKRDWTDALVYYEIEDGFIEAVQIQIESAIWMWTQSSPARFVESTTASDRVVFTPLSSSSCVSYVGMVGGAQMIGVHADGGCNVGRIAHEMGHAMGFYHEHTRPDRGNYITINEDNILDGYTSQFDEQTGREYAAHPYDYGSLMHYPVDGFTSGSSSVSSVLGYSTTDTISVLDDPFEEFLEIYENDLPDETLGQRYFLSSIDKTMGYTYMGANCVDSDTSSSDYEWEVGEWGGCEVQCPVSFRQRGVYCRLDGECQPDSACNATERPVSRKPCELSAEYNNVTFDQSKWEEKGLPMQNVGLYDQYDWYLHRGHPIDFDTAQDYIVGISDRGPGVDGDGNADGHYIWFTSMRPAVENDEAWFESPIIRTDGEEPCTVDFKFFNAGQRGFLTVKIVSCDDCNDKSKLWRSSKGARNDGWRDVSLTVPEQTADVRLRFVANRGNDGTGELGLDNIVFGEGCYRAAADLEEDYAEFDFHQNMSSPYDWDYDCIFFPGWGWSWTLENVLYVTAGTACFACCCLCWIEIGLKIRKRFTAKKLMKDAKTQEEYHAHQEAAKLHNPVLLVKHSFNGLYERFNRIHGAFKTAWQMARQAEYEELDEMVHVNKSTRTSEDKRTEEAELKKMKRNILHRSKVKLHHWLEKVGTIDRIDQILGIFSCGMIKQTGLHPKYAEKEAKGVKSRRSNRELSPFPSRSVSLSETPAQTSGPEKEGASLEDEEVYDSDDEAAGTRRRSAGSVSIDV